MCAHAYHRDGQVETTDLLYDTMMWIRLSPHSTSLTSEKKNIIRWIQYHWASRVHILGRGAPNCGLWIGVQCVPTGIGLAVVTHQPTALGFCYINVRHKEQCAIVPGVFSPLSINAGTNARPVRNSVSISP